MTDQEKVLFEEYKEYIFTHSVPDGEIVAKDDFHLRINSPYAEGQVNFYDLVEANAFVVELCVMQKKNDQACFYLHFELSEDIAYAKELFTEMLGSYIALKDAGKTKILLCCTSAFTTSYFANKLNETAEFLSLPYEFSAVSYDRVFRVAFDYDMVLLAPQVAFHEEAVKMIFDDIPVLPVPATVFASYDASGLIETVRKELVAFQKAAKAAREAHIAQSFPSKNNVLSIAVIRNWGHSQIACRIYEKGVPGREETVLKGRLDLFRDVCDILDTAALFGTKIDKVAISLPGIVRDGHVLMDVGIAPNVDLAADLEKKYGLPVLLMNDANAAAAGLAGKEKESGSVAFYFLPDYSFAGSVGIAVDGKIHEGCHHVAGEMRFVTKALYPQADLMMPNTDIKQMTMNVASLCTKVIVSTLDPKVICVCSRIISQADELREEVLKDIPEDFMPKIITCNEGEMKEYMLFGAMVSIAG